MASTSSTLPSNGPEYPLQAVFNHFNIHWRSQKLRSKPQDADALAHIVEEVYESLDLQSAFEANVARGVVYCVRSWEQYSRKQLKTTQRDANAHLYTQQNFYFIQPVKGLGGQGQVESGFTRFMLAGILLLDYLLAAHDPCSAADLCQQDVGEVHPWEIYQGTSAPLLPSLAGHASGFRQGKNLTWVTAEAWDEAMIRIQGSGPSEGEPTLLTWDAELKRAGLTCEEGCRTVVRLARVATVIRYLSRLVRPSSLYVSSGLIQQGFSIIE
jgi:hypothetical protein